MSKKPPAKYRLTQEKVWVARRLGTATGIGSTPAAAFSNAAERNRRSQERTSRISELAGLNDRMKGELNKTQYELHRARVAVFGLQSGTAENPNDVADGFVMMAMAYCRTTNPTKALDMLRGKTAITEKDEAAAQRVKGYMERWIKSLGNPESAHD